MSVKTIKGIDINYEIDGPESSESVFMIHGFPDSLKTWRELYPLLNDAGYRTIRIDLPGFGESEIPDLEMMRLDRLTEILHLFLQELNVGKVHLIGHDWGAVTSWFFADRYKEDIKSFTALSVGHPSSYLDGGFSQLTKAWYVLLILNDNHLAEQLFSADDWSLFKTYFGADGFDEYWLPDLKRDGRLTSTMNIYRANLNPEYSEDIMTTVGTIESNVLAIYGGKDLSLTPEQIKKSDAYVDSEFETFVVEDGAHFLPLHNAEDIAPRIIEFLDKESD